MRAAFRDIQFLPLNFTSSRWTKLDLQEVLEPLAEASGTNGSPVLACFSTVHLLSKVAKVLLEANADPYAQDRPQQREGDLPLAEGKHRKNPST